MTERKHFIKAMLFTKLGRGARCVAMNPRRHCEAPQSHPQKEVHQAEKVNGEHVQKLTIYYNCVGVIEIPNISALPEPQVRVQTRKGVVVNYAGAHTTQNAV
jgi:hypothetical protein